MRPGKVKGILLLFLVFPISSFFLLFVDLKNKVAGSEVLGDGFPGDSLWAVWPRSFLSVRYLDIFELHLGFSFQDFIKK